MPKNAKEKSLPAEVYYQGYCVLPTSKTFDKGKDRIYLTINCHGFLNDQVEEYYDTMRQTFLRNYGFSEEQNNNPDSCYWCGMMMRGLRALQYVKTLPEWDGVNLITSGVSQGGMQCLTIAGLDPDVTEVHAVIPWFCDVSGAEKNGRIDSWFMPRWVDGLGYFDTTNHAKRIRGKVEIYAGLGDYVSSVWRSGPYNSIKSEVKLQFRQGRTHELKCLTASSSVWRNRLNDSSLGSETLVSRRTGIDSRLSHSSMRGLWNGSRYVIRAFPILRSFHLLNRKIIMKKRLFS